MSNGTSPMTHDEDVRLVEGPQDDEGPTMHNALESARAKKNGNALRPWAFAYLYDTLVVVARNLGYALALHGSMTRDLDLIACPWTADAVPAAVLIAAINESAGGFVYEESLGNPREGRDPEQKPHGRLAWSLHFNGQPYIDISVMPCLESLLDALVAEREAREVSDLAGEARWDEEAIGAWEHWLYQDDYDAARDRVEHLLKGEGQ